MGGLLLAGCTDELSAFECQRGMYTLEQKNQIIDPSKPEFSAGDEYINARPAQNPSLYYVGLEIGSPGQNQILVADTGSSDLVLAGDKSICASCESKTTYTPGASAKDLDRRTLTIEYGSGGGVMDAYSDQVKLACTEENPSEISFGVMTSAKNLKNGILGLAYAPLSRVGAESGQVFFDELVKNNQGKLNDVFTMTLCGANAGSSIVFGNYDSRVPTSSLKRTPIVEESHYVVDAKKLLVRGWTNAQGAWVEDASAKGSLGDFTAFDSQTHSGIRTIVDSGTTMIYFTPEVVRQARALMRAASAKLRTGIPDGFWEATPQSADYAINIDAGLIDKFPTLVVQMAGAEGADLELEMAPSTYFKSWDLGKRVFSFREVGGLDNTQILGQVFMENHHVAFERHRKQIGFAPNLAICQKK